MIISQQLGPTAKGLSVSRSAGALPIAVHNIPSPIDTHVEPFKKEKDSLEIATPSKSSISCAQSRSSLTKAWSSMICE